MATNKPARMEITEQAKKQVIGVAVTDNTGQRVHGVELVLGTEATTGALNVAKKRVLEETQKFVEGMDAVKKRKLIQAVEVENKGPKLR